MSGLCAEDKALLRVKVGVSEALGADPVLAAVEQIVAREVAAAEQRGREDNEDHGLCYVHGSKALEAYVAEHVARFKAEAVDELTVEAMRHSGVAYSLCDAYQRAARIVANLTPSDP